MTPNRILKIAQELIGIKRNTCQDHDWESKLADWVFLGLLIGSLVTGWILSW